MANDSIAPLISYPVLPRPREREISLFSVRQSEIWVRDYRLCKGIQGKRARSIQPKFPESRSKTQWIGLVQPEKFRKNGSTFWGRPLFPVGPVGILVERIAPHGDCAIQVLYSVRIHFSVDWLRFGIPILSGIWIISFGLYSRFQSSGFQIPQAKIHGTNLFYRYILLSVI